MMYPAYKLRSEERRVGKECDVLCRSQQTGEKFLRRWEYQTTLPLFWKTCKWVKKQQLELNMEQLTASKLEKESNKAVYVTLLV